jgi:hypothetical protein
LATDLTIIIFSVLNRLWSRGRVCLIPFHGSWR